VVPFLFLSLGVGWGEVKHNVFDLVPCQTGNQVITIQIWSYLLSSLFASKI
jgi:hypothetical protein